MVAYAVTAGWASTVYNRVCSHLTWPTSIVLKKIEFFLTIGVEVGLGKRNDEWVTIVTGVVAYAIATGWAIKI